MKGLRDLKEVEDISGELREYLDFLIEEKKLDDTSCYNLIDYVQHYLKEAYQDGVDDGFRYALDKVDDALDDWPDRRYIG